MRPDSKSKIDRRDLLRALGAGAGAAASKATVPNSINDVARITLGPFNPFNLNEDPRGPANPYT